MRLVKIYERGKLLLDLRLRSTFRPRTSNREYNRIYEVEAIPKAEFPNEEKLSQYVQNLAERYLERGFKLEKLGNLYRISSKRANGKFTNLTLFFDLENQTIFVPISFLTTRQKMRQYLIFRALGTLGLVQGRYAGKLA
jgi:hypothetical protein